MASRLTPYIAFDGNAREAMQFYQEVFGGDWPATPSPSSVNRTPPTRTSSCTPSSTPPAGTR